MVRDRVPGPAAKSCPPQAGQPEASVAYGKPEAGSLLLALTATGMSLEEAAEELWLHSGLPLAALADGVLGLDWPDPFVPLRVVAMMCGSRRVEGLKAVLERRGIHPIAIALGRVEIDPRDPVDDSPTSPFRSIAKAKALAVRLGANPDWIDEHTGMLRIGPVGELETWPEGLEVIPRGVKITTQMNLRELPPRMVIGGHLEINLCGGLEALPEDLVAERLLVNDCPELRSAPVRLRALAPDECMTVQMSGCPSLRNVAVWEVTLRSLNLIGSGVEVLPKGIRFDGLAAIGLSETPIRKLPDDLTSLLIGRFQNCVHLEELPYGLTVKGRMNLNGCVGLQRLPEHLVVGGDLDLRGCSALKELPQDLSVSGSVFMNGCTAWNQDVPPNIRVSNER